MHLSLKFFLSYSHSLIFSVFFLFLFPKAQACSSSSPFSLPFFISLFFLTISSSKLSFPFFLHLPFFHSLYLHSVSSLLTTYFPPAKSFIEMFCVFPQATYVIRIIQSHDESRFLPLVHFLLAQLPMNLYDN